MQQLITFLYVSIAMLNIRSDAVGLIMNLFELKSVVDCIRDVFITTQQASSRIECFSTCAGNEECKGVYATQAKSCQMQIVPKATHKVNMDKLCIANNTNMLWVKATNACPNSFNNEFYGSKYQTGESIHDHDGAKRYCESLSPYSRLADVLDMEEMNHLHTKFKHPDNVYRLDGMQAPGAIEPNGSWKWTMADVDFDANLWYTGEPSNVGIDEDCVAMFKNFTKLVDLSCNAYGQTYALCECVGI